MAYTPISNTVPQYSADASGTSASGYYLKFYADGTTTPISIATDSTGGTLLAKCQLDSLGYPTTDGTVIFIPHIEQTYKLALYTNATDADNNTLASAVWVVDNIEPVVTNPNSGQHVKNFATLAAAVADTGLIDGDTCYIQERTTGNGGESHWKIVLSSTVTENTYDIVQCTGVPTLSAVLLTESATVQGDALGIIADDSTDSTAIIEHAINTMLNAEGGVLELPEGLIRFSQLDLASSNSNAPLMIRGKGMGVTILRSTLTGVHGDFAIEIGDTGVSNSGLVQLDELTVNGQNTTGEVGGVYIQQCRRYEIAGGNVRVEYFKEGRGLRLESSWLSNFGKWFFIFCYKPAEFSAVLSCQIDSIDAEQSGPVPASEPPNWPTSEGAWLYDHSTIPDTDPSLDLINTGGFFSKVEIEASFAKNLTKLSETSTIGALYSEGNYNWQDEGNEVQLSGYRPTILNGYISFSTSATTPNQRYVVDCGDSTEAFVRLYANNNPAAPTNTRYGVNLNTSDRADIDIHEHQYEQGVTKISEYQTYLAPSLKRYRYNDQKFAGGMTEFELGRLLVQDYNAFDASTFLCERQEGTGGYPGRAKNFLLTNTTPTGSIVEQHDAPFGLKVAAGLQTDGSANSAQADFTAGTLADETYYMSTFLFNSSGTLTLKARVVDGITTGSTLGLHEVITTNQAGWYRASRIQALTKASTETVRFKIDLDSLNELAYFKGALLINLTQFDADNGTDLLNYSVADLDRIISAEVLSSFSREFYVDAAPTTGTWQVGDKVLNASPTSAATMGWVCTTAGTPGTWTAMPNLA